MIIDEMMTSRKLSNLGVDKKTNHQIAYSRLRDIRNGLKAPVRMSEFLLICDVCRADPVQALRDIIAEAARIRAARDSPHARERCGFLRR